MKQFFPLLLSALMLIAHTSPGQNNGPEVKGDKLYSQLAYSEAIVEYQKVLVKEPENEKVLRNIADCYRLTSNTEQSELYYSKVVKLAGARPLDKFYYAQSLMYNAKYEAAKTYIEEYGAIHTTDERVTNFLKAIGKIDEFYKDSSKTRVHKIPINSDKADFCPVYYKNGVVFTSSRESGGGRNRVHTW